MSKGKQRLSFYASEHHGRIRRWVARRLRSSADAEDIAQETWLRAAPVLANGAVANVEAYLLRIASNLIVDRMREARKWDGIIVPDAANTDAEAPEPDAEARLIERDRLAHLATLVETLPPRCREVFLLRKSEGLSSRDIAGRLGIGRNMVDKHLRLAFSTIATRMGEIEE